MLAAVLALALAAALPPGPPGPAARLVQTDTTEEWSVTVAAWNLLNFGTNKAGLTQRGGPNSNLLDRYASIMSRYDIVFVQELLDDGSSLTQGIAQRPAMANYNCQNISLPSGRRGRRERYGICYANARIQLTRYDYMTRDSVTAVDNTRRTPQDVWMRPPLRATFTYTKPDGDTFQFTVYVDHTKPAYSAGARPPGTPPNAPANSSVYYELMALQMNRIPAPRAMFIGDLNADCASYPRAYRGQNFAYWNWYIDYGEKTNTAPRSNCAYDRIIMNDSLKAYYKDHGIYTQGINTRVDGERVSDHYLVWVRFGGTVQKRRQLVASTGFTVATGQRDFIVGKRLSINATGMDPSQRGSRLFIVPYSATAHYSGNQTYSLADVRGLPTWVPIDTSGSFTRDVVWNSPVKGLYTLVLDVNGDGRYNKNDGDFVNHDNQIDLIVLDSRTGHNDVVTLGDDGRVSELFDEDVAQNVYVLARNLPPNDSVDVYVLATKLLPADFTWLNPRVSLDLPIVSIPVNLSHGPLVANQINPVDRRLRLRTSPEGTLFASAWEQPYRLMNTPVLIQSPPIPDYRPEYAQDESDAVDDDFADECRDPWRSPDIFFEQVCEAYDIDFDDPCENAWRSPDANFQQVCNVGNLFTDYYGTSFNVVLDVNRNGLFDVGDKVDAHDIGDLTTFFRNPANPVLDESANGDPAVGEYKEYLNAKLNLSTPLDDNDVYDEATRQASGLYMCTPVLPRLRFGLVEQGSLEGFRMLNEADYLHQQRMGSGLYNFERLFLESSTISNGSSLCVRGESVVIDDLAVEPNTRTAVIADEHEITGTVTLSENSTTCMHAFRGFMMRAGSTIFALPGEVVGVAFAVTVGTSIQAWLSWKHLRTCK